MLPCKRRGAEIGVSTRGEIGRRSGTMAAIAVDNGVNEVAAQSDQLAVFSVILELDRSDLESAFNPCFL